MAADPSSFCGAERLFYGAIGTVIGFTLNEVRSLWLKRRKHLAYWAALNAEIEYARGRAQMYIDDKIIAPLYRLPTKAFDKCFGELLADGALTEAEATSLMAFFAEVETFNRGLDRAAAATNASELDREYGRNLLKVKQLVSTGALYTAAKSSVNAHATP